MKKLTKYITSIFAGAIILLHASTASAALIEFDYNNTVTVGDTFTVDVFLDIPVGLELTGFGFDLTSASGNVAFDGVNFASFLTGDVFNDVGAGITDPFASITGDNVFLATMSFTADSIGNDVVSLLGDAFNFGGLFFLDAANNFFPVDEDINTSFDINVVAATNAVPAPGALGLMLLGAAGLLVRRRV